MKPNIGKLDRMLRIALGLALLALFVVAPAPLKWVGLVGIVPLGTAFIRFCPLYPLVGINTCEKE